MTPAPRRRVQRRARRSLTPAPWLVPVTPDVRRRLAVIQREWQRVDPKYLDEDEQRYWATIAGRQIRFDERASFVRSSPNAARRRRALEQFLATCAAENPNRRLRMIALSDRVSMRVERADFDDLVTLVTQAPTWEKDRLRGIRILLRAVAEGKADAPEQILARWTWRLARASRKVQDRRASSGVPRGETTARVRSQTRAGTVTRRTRRGSSTTALELPLHVGAALLASAEGYTPARDPADRRGAGAARVDRQEVAGRAGREPAAAEAHIRPVTAAEAAAQKKQQDTQAVEQTQGDATASHAEAETSATQPAEEQRSAENGAAPRKRRRRKPSQSSSDGRDTPMPEPAPAADA